MSGRPQSLLASFDVPGIQGSREIDALVHDAQNAIAGICGALHVVGQRLPSDFADRFVLDEIYARLNTLEDVVRRLEHADVQIVATERPERRMARAIEGRESLRRTIDRLIAVLGCDAALLPETRQRQLLRSELYQLIAGLAARSELQRSSGDVTSTREDLAVAGESDLSLQRRLAELIHRLTDADLTQLKNAIAEFLVRIDAD
jgi:hypothetical protein